MNIVSLFERLTPASRPTLGLDIGSHAVKLVELAGNDFSFIVRRVGQALISPESIVDGSVRAPEDVSHVVRDLVQNLSPRLSHVATSIAGYSVIVKKIVVPYADEREIEDNLLVEAENYVPFEIDEVYVDFHILVGTGSAEKMQSEIFLVAAKKEVVDDYAALIQDVGLSPAVVDVDAFALGNAFEGAFGKLSEAVVLVDIGASKTNLNIVSNGNSLFARDMAIGGRQLTEALQNATGLNYGEAEGLKISGSSDNGLNREAAAVCEELCRLWGAELRKAIDFFVASAKTNERPTQVLLSGGCALLRGIDKFLEKEIRIPVSLFDPWRTMSADKDIDPDYFASLGPQMAIATGLALRTVQR
jgi:type IV pilus assembly protein PilM